MYCFWVYILIFHFRYVLIFLFRYVLIFFSRYVLTFLFRYVLTFFFQVCSQIRSPYLQKRNWVYLSEVSLYQLLLPQYSSIFACCIATLKTLISKKIRSAIIDHRVLNIFITRAAPSILLKCHLLCETLDLMRSAFVFFRNNS